MLQVDREALRKRVGTTLRQRYTLDALLDVGGMAAVYAATHRSGRRVAVKILHGSLVSDADVCQRFLREGYVANAVEHPGAVAVLDDDKAEDGAPFLVMELLRGVTLHDRLGDVGALSPEEALYVVDQVLDVLIAAHDKGIVHRDVKPANVFLTRDGSVKLLDFGLARMRREVFADDPTRQGLVLGTPSFMAPEQARGQNDQIDWRTDIWSVGAIGFNALSGRHVHDAPTSTERLLAAATRPAPSLASLLPGLTKAVVQVIDTALAFDKERRFQTARLMQQATRRAYQAMTREAGGDAGAGAQPSWTGAADTDADRRAPGLASVTLHSEQPAASAPRSIEVEFEDSIPFVVHDPAKRPAEPTLPSSHERAPDGELAVGVEVVTDSLIVDSAVTPSAEPAGPPLDVAKKRTT